MKTLKTSIPDGCPRARVSDVTPQVEALLVLLGARGPLSESGIRAGLRVGDRRGVRWGYVMPALGAGVIEEVGEGRGRRYGLTGWGMEVVKGVLGRVPAGMEAGVWRRIRASLRIPAMPDSDSKDGGQHRSEATQSG